MRVLWFFVVLAILTPMQALATTCWDVPSDPCELPANFTNSIVIEEAGIRVTFASETAAYSLGSVVEFRLKFENIGSQYFCMNWLYQPIDAVFVLPEGCTSFADPCFGERPWSYPGIIYFAPGAGVGLDPGECRVFSYSWDLSADPASVGNYTVVSGLFEASFDGQVGEFRMPLNGAALSLQIVTNVPSLPESMGLWKTRFR